MKVKKIVSISLETIFWIVVIWLIIQGNRIVDRIIEPTNVNSDIPNDASFYVLLGVMMMIFFAYIIKRLLKFVANIFLGRQQRLEMLIKIKNIFCLVSILIFITLTASFYFSDQNIRATNKFRSFYAVKLLHDTLKLPLLTNDTKGIIEYRNDVQEFVDKRKKWIWEGLIIN